MEGISFVELLTVGGLFGLIGLFIAKRRDLDPALGFILGFFIGPIGWIIVSVKRPDPPLRRSSIASITPKASARRERKCPFCAEMVLEEATICRFCNRELPKPTPVDKSPIFRSYLAR